MGQSAVELPDPLQTPPAMDAAGADDLLAQLAGDEIDRLLAEADAEYLTPAPPADPPPAPTPATVPDASPATPSDSPGDPAPGDAASLDDMLARSYTIPPTEDADPPAATAATPAARPPRSAADELAQELDRQDASPLSDPAAAHSDAESSKTASLPDVLDEILAADRAEDVPLYLRPLLWLNAPFAGLSEQARTALGWIAIVTFFNAVAVLAYVLFFRA